MLSSVPPPPPLPDPDESTPRLAAADDHAALLAALPGQVVASVATEPPLIIHTGQGWFITAEGQVQLCQPGQPVTAFDGSTAEAAAGLNPHLEGKRITYASLEGSALWVQLANGTGLMMPAEPQYETWQVCGAEGQRLVCGPGGVLTQWNATAPVDIGSAAYTWTVPRKRMAASVVFTDGQGRVLLCEPTDKAVWGPPGGAVEADEPPHDAAEREVREELGLDIPVGRLLTVDWVPSVSGRSEGIVFVYDGGRLSDEQTAAITLPPDELRSWAWCTVEQAHERLRPVVARHLTAALEVSATGGMTVELAHGYPRHATP